MQENVQGLPRRHLVHPGLRHRFPKARLAAAIALGLTLVNVSIAGHAADADRNVATSSATPAMQPDQDASTPASTTQTTSAAKAKNAKPAATELSTVTVSALRNSLERSMDLKRYANGVVDAVSAEDIGKFPDTNLADSLQRITGVSIDRRNGEGANVTVRGFGPQFNMVTVDGRVIPGADAFGSNGQIPLGNVDSGTRAFNFAQLSPDGVSTLEVYKTGRANVPSGGIGATIDIQTDRPFNHEGGKVISSLSAKGDYDTSEPFGNSVTPTVSGVFSYANPDKTWGISVNASYQKRHGGQAEATENAWNVKTWDGGYNDGAITPGVTSVVNPPAMGQLYAIPNDLRYAFYDFKTERKNAHTVLQLHPTDSLTMSLDYLYSRYDVDANRGEQGTWLQQRFTDIEFDTNQAVATPVYLRDVVQNKDFGMEQQRYTQQYKLDSAGLNLRWDVTDAFSLTFDGHDSKSQSVPNGANGVGALYIDLGGTNVCNGGADMSSVQCGGGWAQEFRFNNSLPIATRTWYPTMDDAVNNAGNGQTNTPFEQKNLGVGPLRIYANSQITEVKEGRLDGAVNFDTGLLQFGVGYNRTTTHNLNAAEVAYDIGNWGLNNAGVYPDLMSLITPADIAGLFKDYNTDGIANSVWRGNADALAQWAASHYPGVTLAPSRIMANDNRVTEATKAAYAQLELNGSIGSMNTTTVFGLRYEQTNLRSTSMVAVPDEIVWQSNNDFRINRSSDLQPFSETTKYNYVLPNIDFSIQLTDSLIGRASYSKTLARAPYGNLYAGPSPNAPTGSILIDPSARGSGSDQNPALKPLTSDNLDLGAEWYFAPSSYVSLTFWNKRVENFIGSGVTQETLYGLRDPSSGPRAQQALAFLNSQACVNQVTAAGNNATLACSADLTSLFTAVSLITHPGETGGLAAFNGGSSQAIAMEDAYDITANSDDPLYTFDVTKPVNQHTGKLNGWEFGGQYFFGDSGVGVQANYTKVNGDVHFNNAASPAVDQFALLGLSDTANVVLMYEKYGWSARLAWNWRGQNLAITNMGDSRNPLYIDAYHQFDLSVTYDVNDHLSLMLEGTNLTGEDIRWHARSDKQMWRLVDQQPRYALGVRYKF